MSVKRLMKLAMVAALYVVLTVCFAPLSYGSVQFRFAEILMLLIVFRKDYLGALVIGCMVSNMFSSLGIIDVLVGSFATLIAGLMMIVVKNLYVTWIFPVIFNGLFVGLEIVLVDEMKPFWSSLFFMGGSVAIGEAVVLLIGVVIFKLLERNEGFMKLIKE